MSMVAVGTNTPMPAVWGMTIGQLCRYAAVVPKILPMLNPFAESGGDTEKPITKTKEAIVLFDAFGFEVDPRLRT